MRARLSLQSEEGFTLVELIISFIILALIVYAAFNLLDANITAGTTYTLRTDIGQELKESTGTMVDQLRTAAAFTNALGSDVSFTSYLTGTSDLYNVQFLLDGGDLIHRSGTGVLSETDNKVLASNVTALQFTYYDSAGSVLADPNITLSSIAMIGIKLTMTLSSADTVLTDSMETMVRVRK